ncbi:MAG TPA: TatD family deoxyribonuclease [Chloroflexi bacterium]|nr:TatD family deoxyribonuclease [Chloroflexota bacterium]
MSTLALVDTHCHLNLGAFSNELPQVLARARQAGVLAILVPGIDLETSRSAVKLAEGHADLFAAVGVHPHHASQWDDQTARELEVAASSGRVVAIGEIGLDYYRMLSTKEQQQRAFKAQLEIARALEIPVVIHLRESETDTLAILRDWSEDLPAALRGRAGVLHAFSASNHAASQAVQMGFYIGIAGPITYPRADDLRRIVGNLPGERLLTETDAPYLAPAPYRGKRNEPAYVGTITETVAEIRGMEPESAGRLLADNARGLFRWDYESTNRDVS